MAVVFWFIGLNLDFLDSMRGGGDLGLIFAAGIFGLFVVWLVSLIVDPGVNHLSRTALVIGYFGMTFGLAAYLHLGWVDIAHDVPTPRPGESHYLFGAVLVMMIYGAVLFVIGLVSWFIGWILSSRS